MGGWRQQEGDDPRAPLISSVLSTSRHKKLGGLRPLFRLSLLFRIIKIITQSRSLFLCTCVRMSKPDPMPLHHIRSSSLLTHVQIPLQSPVFRVLPVDALSSAKAFSFILAKFKALMKNQCMPFFSLIKSKQHNLYMPLALCLHSSFLSPVSACV